ncbi:MAG TPA: T9SS type A sorting domain-containing protein, partial [Chitinophagales bacterium]|nr:T9SS type A sorting domain-containing protein [Chitinophagales bacterium]
SSVIDAYSQFIAIYGVPGKDIRFTAVASYDGGYLAAGTMDNGIVLVKFDEFGSVVTASALSVGLPTTLQPVKSMIVDSEGNVVLAGYRDNGDSELNKAFVVKMNFETETVLWKKLYENDGSNLFKIIEKPDGNYMACGNIRTPGDLHNLLVEIDRETGEWTFKDLSSHHPDSDSYYSLVEVDGKYFTCSRTQYYGGGSNKMRANITRFNGVGLMNYSKSYIVDTLGNARFYGADITANNNRILMLANGDDNGSSVSRDLYMVNATPSGTAKWVRKVNLTDYTDDGIWLAAKPVGTTAFLVAGSLYNPEDPNGYGHGGKMFAMLCSGVGSIIWANVYEMESDYYYYLGHSDMLVAEGTDMIMVGSRLDSISGERQGMLMKANILTGGTLPDDCSSPLSISVSTGSNISQPIDMDPIVDISGFSEPVTLLTPGVPLELLDSGCSDVMKQSQEYIAEDQILLFPNPVKDELLVKLPDTRTEQSSYQIYSTEGKLLLKGSYLNNGLLSINLFDLPSGMYILVLEADTTLYTGSFIKE